MLIQAQRLTKTYLEGGTRHPVLTGVDLQVAAGECVALLGRSGCGKSTLLNLLAGIDRPDSGAVSIDGRDLHLLSERERTLFRRSGIGFVYQFFNLIPTLSVAENVRLPLELNRWPEGRIVQRVESLLEQLGLGERAGTFPDRLSGGEQQRVAIARALGPEPPLVLADEPTGNLDATSGQQILELLLQLTRGNGHTLLVVTHSLAVARAADRLLLLEEGQLRQGDIELAW